MARSKEELLELTKEELLEEARKLDIDGRSGMNKEELAQAIAAVESGSDSMADRMEPVHEGGRGVAQTEDTDVASRLREDEADPRLAEAAAEFEASHDEEADIEAQYDQTQPDVAAEKQMTHHLPASDPENPAVKEGLSPEGQRALEEVGDKSVYAQESDLALDASGPLHFEEPSSRVMTGAVNEGHAKEQEELLEKMPDDFVGNVSEAGFSEAGDPVHAGSYADFAFARGAEEAAAESDARDRLGDLRKDNLSENDDRELSEVRPDHVIDFPPPVGKRSFDPDLPEDKQTVQMPPRGVFSAHASPSAPAHNAQLDSRRTYQQKAQFYTDDVSGEADHNHERAYEYSELMQSNNPQVRKAGDVSVSEAMWKAKADHEKERAEAVKTRDDGAR